MQPPKIQTNSTTGKTSMSQTSRGGPMLTIGVVVSLVLSSLSLAIQLHNEYRSSLARDEFRRAMQDLAVTRDQPPQPRPRSTKLAR